MDLQEIVYRKRPPQPWDEGEKIPWDDPAFSERMLKEHLSQHHDAASRRSGAIDSHVRWIHDELLLGKPTRVLDLGCGPGFYCHRLARFGHRCVGIDFAPSAIIYAKSEAGRENLSCHFVESDVRTANFGTDFGLVMMLYGEINVFRPSDVEHIVAKAHAALAKQGLLLLEVSTLDAVQKLGEEPPSWYSAEIGLFSSQPHLCLTESTWIQDRKVAVERFYVIDVSDGSVTRHAASTQGYAADEWHTMLTNCGFSDIEIRSSTVWVEATGQDSLQLVIARKR
jgi:SAM-dependent methyltransferase